MISVKNGTQTWSNSEQISSLKPDAANTLPPDLMKKHFGDKDVGTIANELTDPNYVDKSKTVKGHGDAGLNKDAFFKLMLTQLKYQDPTSPLESHEMAAQLAQFTSLEKLSNINDSIEALRKGQEPSTNFQSLNLIGKGIRSDSSRIFRVEGDKSHELNFDLKADSTSAEIKIRDSKGKEVRVLEAKNLKKGANLVKWDGKTTDGIVARPDEYAIEITAKSSNGQKIQVETLTEGVITGVNFTAAGPVLMLGDQTVKLSDVKKIWDPSIKKAPVAAQEVAVKDKAAPPEAGMVNKAAQEKTPDVVSNMDEIPMDDALRAKLAGKKE